MTDFQVNNKIQTSLLTNTNQGTDDIEKKLSKTLDSNTPAIVMIGLQGNMSYKYDGESTMSRTMNSHFVTITEIEIEKYQAKPF